jgi:hypothetical protein
MRWTRVDAAEVADRNRRGERVVGTADQRQCGKRVVYAADRSQRGEHVVDAADRSRHSERVVGAAEAHSRRPVKLACIAQPPFNGCGTKKLTLGRETLSFIGCSV